MTTLKADRFVMKNYEPSEIRDQNGHSRLGRGGWDEGYFVARRDKHIQSPNHSFWGHGRDRAVTIC